MKRWLPIVFFGVVAFSAVVWFATRKSAMPKGISKVQLRPNHLVHATDAPVVAPIIAVQNGSAHAVAKVNGEPIPVMNRVENFINSGRETPAAAFQTLIWAALKGDDDEFAATVVFGDGAREEAETWRRTLPAEMQEKYADVEKLPGLFLTEEIVRKAATAQVLEVIEVAPDRVRLRVQTSTIDGGNRISVLPLRRGDRGWGFEIPADMVLAMRRMPAKR